MLTYEHLIPIKSYDNNTGNDLIYPPNKGAKTIIINRIKYHNYKYRQIRVSIIIRVAKIYKKIRNRTIGNKKNTRRNNKCKKRFLILNIVSVSKIGTITCRREQFVNNIQKIYNLNKNEKMNTKGPDHPRAIRKKKYSRCKISYKMSFVA